MVTKTGILVGILPLLAALAPQSGFANIYVVSGARLQVYSQSHKESTAHMAESDIPLLNGSEHPQCGRRLYVGLGDREVMAAILAARLADRPVNIIYDDASAQMHVYGHNLITCKLISVWY